MTARSEWQRIAITGISKITYIKIPIKNDEIVSNG
jgi:hypothetical protein